MARPEGLPMDRSTAEKKETSQKKRQAFQEVEVTGQFKNGRPVGNEERKWVSGMANQKTNLGHTKIPASKATAKSYGSAITDVKQSRARNFSQKYRTYCPLQPLNRMQTVLWQPNIQSNSKREKRNAGRPARIVRCRPRLLSLLTSYRQSPSSSPRLRTRRSRMVLKVGTLEYLHTVDMKPSRLSADSGYRVMGKPGSGWSRRKNGTVRVPHQEETVPDTEKDAPPPTRKRVEGAELRDA